MLEALSGLLLAFVNMQHTVHMLLPLITLCSHHTHEPILAIQWLQCSLTMTVQRQSVALLFIPPRLVYTWEFPQRSAQGEWQRSEIPWCSPALPWHSPAGGIADPPVRSTTRFSIPTVSSDVWGTVVSLGMMCVQAVIACYPFAALSAVRRS